MPSFRPRYISSGSPSARLSLSSSSRLSSVLGLEFSLVAWLGCQLRSWLQVTHEIYIDSEAAFGSVFRWYREVQLGFENRCASASCFVVVFNMTSSYFLLGLVGCLYISSVWSLQVTPNSPCSILCIDDPTTDVSDPNSSNTYRSDIVCNDADYVGTSVGRKFKQCLTCLQNSTASSGSESDQGWFFCTFTCFLDGEVLLIMIQTIFDMHSIPAYLMLQMLRIQSRLLARRTPYVLR